MDGERKAREMNNESAEPRDLTPELEQWVDWELLFQDTHYPSHFTVCLLASQSVGKFIPSIPSSFPAPPWRPLEAKYQAGSGGLLRGRGAKGLHELPDE